MTFKYVEGQVWNEVFETLSEKGKPMTGSLEKLWGWWKEQVKFNKNGTPAIAKYEE